MGIASAWHRLKALAARRRLDRDLADELAFHLAMREDEYVAAGMARDDARVAARRQFGNVTHFKEESRDMWMFSSFETLAQDTRYTLRTLGRAPGFTAVAVAVLAIGIGGNTAIFSLVDAMRTHALPYRNADRLVELWGNVMRTKVERRGASFPDFTDWRAQATSFEDMAAFDGQLMTLAGGDEPERVNTEFVSASYFSLLGISPARGRTFRSDEDDVGKPAPVAVVSDGLWKRRFGGDPQIIGRAVTLNARAYTVVGVMPPGFKGLSDEAELWIPFALYAPPRVMAERGSRGFAVLAKLKPGVGLAAAQAELDAISKQLARTYADTNANRGVEASPLDVELFGTLRPALLTLMAAVAFVLLIACANVANLLIARSEARRREIAVRTALGAGRGRLLRQLITEGCVLTAIGAAVGLVLARAAVAALVSASPVTFPSFVSPGLDVRVAGFTVLLSVVCGVLVGLAPAMQARVDAIGDALKESARGSDGRRSQQMRNALVVAEVSLAVVLLVGAGLMIRSVRNLSALNPGFDASSVLTLHVSIQRAAAPPGLPATPSVYGRTLLARIGSVPGVVQAAIGTDLPLDGDSSAAFYSAEGQPAVTAQNIPRAYVHRVSPGFFGTLHIPMASGRTFTDADAMPSSPAVIVSERVWKRFWPDDSPIGKRVKFGPLTSDNPWMSIVGVVGDVKYRGLPENPNCRSGHLSSVPRPQQSGLHCRSHERATRVGGVFDSCGNSRCRSVDRRLSCDAAQRACQRANGAVPFHDLADGGICRGGAPSCRCRHLRRDVVSGHAAHAGDRHQARAWRDARACAQAHRGKRCADDRRRNSHRRCGVVRADARSLLAAVRRYGNRCGLCFCHRRSRHRRADRLLRAGRARDASQPAAGAAVRIRAGRAGSQVGRVGKPAGVSPVIDSEARCGTCCPQVRSIRDQACRRALQQSSARSAGRDQHRGRGGKDRAARTG